MKRLLALTVLMMASLAVASEWRITFPVEDEPGEAMVVSGVVLAADGRTPLEGAVVYAYHTDVDGYYEENSRSNTNPRLKGLMVTDAQGRYEFRSIRPGPYPSGNIPAHVHYVVTPAGGEEETFELVFQDDPLVSDRVKQQAAAGGFWIYRPIEKDDDGVWRVTANLVLSRQGSDS